MTVALAARVVVTAWLLAGSADGGCPFQNPFWFVEKPIVVPVKDPASLGQDPEFNLPNKIKLMWGRMENFKCVDYFQVEYFQRKNPAGTVQMTPRINRHRRSVEIEVTPCVDYFFKVIASEDWKGMREDFKMFSEVIGYKLDYTPMFISPVTVREKRKGEGGVKTRDQLREEKKKATLAAQKRQEDRRRIMNGMAPINGMAADEGSLYTTPPSATLSPEAVIRVAWRLTDIDYPVCLDYFQLEYYDTLYNETGFERTFKRPFRRQKFEVEVSNTVVPCELDFEFYMKVFGYNGEHSLSYWTPPSCVVTTTASTTSTTTVPSTTSLAGLITESTTDLSVQLSEKQEENERLQAKIDGLKQEYEKIGLQVFHAFKESFFTNLEDFLARRRSEEGGGALFGGTNGGRTNGASAGVNGTNSTDTQLFTFR